MRSNRQLNGSKIRGRHWVRLGIERLELKTTPTVFTVSSLADSGPGSLRQAISQANVDLTPDTIVFSVALNGGTIALVSSLPAITDAVTITGPGADQLTISAVRAPGSLYAFNIVPISSAIANQLVDISGLTFKSGRRAVVNNGASLIVDECLFIDNVGHSGAAIYQSAGSLAIKNSTFSGNSTDVLGCFGYCYFDFPYGGAIHIAGGGPVTISNCTLAKNWSGAGGGAIGIEGLSGPFLLENSTVSGNGSAGGVGGIFVGSTNLPVSVISSIIANTNSIEEGFQLDIAATIPIHIDHSIIGVTDGLTIVGSNNLTGTSKNPLDPKLGSLASNGGKMSTLALYPDSPAIDKGSNSKNFSFDQRGAGFSRIGGIAADIGAFEVGPVPYAIASAQLPTVGDPWQMIQVVYNDDLAIDVGSLNTGDIKVSGPSGFVAFPMLESINLNFNGTPRIATYKLVPAGGSWDHSDNGSYTIEILGNQVFDADQAHSVPAGIILRQTIGLQGKFVVDLATDENDGKTSPGDVSLREAIQLANNRPNTGWLPDLISFDPTVFATPQIIGLLFGEMKITDTVTIEGPNVPLSLDAQKASRVFNVQSGNVNLSRLTLVNGKAMASDGGGILVSGGAVSLHHMTIANCTTDRNGGAISLLSGNYVQITNSTLSNNSATNSNSRGGGLHIGNQFGIVDVSASTISGNSSGWSGGGIAIVTGRLRLDGCTVSGNSANLLSTSAGGGGLSVTGADADIFNCTFAENKATRGGGLYLAGSSTYVSAYNSTLAFNSATVAGGGIRRETATYSDLYVKSTVVAANAAANGVDLSGTAKLDFSLLGSSSGATVTGNNNQFNIDPMLASLADNGGLTETCMPLAGSPLINKGNNFDGLGPTYDQRGKGYFRTSGGKTDIGALEVQFPAQVNAIQIAEGTMQRSIIRSIQVTFDRPVTITSTTSAFSLTRIAPSGLQPITTIATVDNSSPTTQVTLTFSGAGIEANRSLADGQYQLEVKSDGIASFDGDGDLVVGGDHILTFHRLFGDGNGDAVVNIADFNDLRLAYGLTGPSPFDFDGDNRVTASDFNQFRLRYGMTLFP